VGFKLFLLFYNLVDLSLYKKDELMGKFIHIISYILKFLGEFMSRYRGPKNRIARRFGVNIFGRARNPLLHKPNPPGMHGVRRRKKSDYGLQLEEKQKLKAVYGMLSERQLVNYYKKARMPPRCRRLPS
jgi:hypothetical protein